MKNIEFLFAAYIMFWLINALYLRSLHRREENIHKRLELLEKRLVEKGQRG